MNDVITYALSDNLIQRLADLLDAEYIRQNRDISRLAFVFGGKRPGMFLKKELSRRLKRGFFGPRFFSIDEYVDYTLKHSGSFARINDLEACFLMYRLVREQTPDILRRRESFAEFLPWAREILKFIEQLDLEDIGADKIQNIQLNAEIGYDVPKDINQLLEHILLLRDAYHAALKRQNTLSRGLRYLMAGAIEQPQLQEFEKIFFCNFFYLHKTQEQLIQHVRNQSKAVLVFQGGREWPVLDKLAVRTGWPIETAAAGQPDYALSIQAGFDLHSQVCLVRDIVKEVPVSEQSVIVLPDANSLIPLVSEVSSLVADFNVSLGYPLKRSPLYSLFECIARAQQTRKEGQYYAKDYLRALSHPLVKNLRLANNDPAVTRILVHKVEEIIIGMEETELGGSLFIDPRQVEASREVYDLALAKTRHMEVRVTHEELKTVLKELHRYLFHQWEGLVSFAAFAASLEQLLQALLEKSFLNNYPLNLKIVERIMGIREEFSRASFGAEPFQQEELFKVFHNSLENEMVNFSGSPLKGLQILGLMETRSLNFGNVIVIDTNENKMPSLKITQPLIPREIMVRLGLDQLEQEEEIQRYQFRRLISSAQKVFLVYEEGARNERSRFIEELLWEREKAQGKLDVLAVSRGQFCVDMQPREVAIKKKKEELEFLRGLPYSASSINAYLQCPLQFYYRYVLGLQEKDDLLDEPEAADIGTFIHELLEDTYKEFLNRKPVINKQFEKFFFAEMDKRFEERLSKRMRSDSFLLKEILDVRMKAFLANERKRQVLQVLGLEQKFTGTIPFGKEEFAFQARVDRIDRLVDGTVAVIDYKTGDVEHILPKSGIDFDAVQFDRAWIRDTIKSFQLPLYLYFLDRKFKGQRTNACLYSIRETGTRELGLVSLLRTEGDFTDKDRLMIEYMNALGFILNEILDPAVDFTPDDSDEHVCGYCPFGALCK
ncbi:MAG TPA: PD-(D/E)XK nuclease family protein [Candidatus Omnitrophota bacterium]|nr:PD-(D/E)XK nuclease family protein [Candidatus Omnitrophota bacterium]